MIKIFYFIHVDWGWIKQRPHFIAEYLSKHFDIDVYYVNNYKMKVMNKDTHDNFNISRLFRLPLERFLFVKYINRLLIKLQLAVLLRKYDIVWLTHPELYLYIKSIVPQGIRVIYDCMDDAMEFPLVKKDISLRKRIECAEISLIRRAEKIIVSSKYLREKLLQRGATPDKIFVSNNAIEIPNETDPILSLPEDIELKFAEMGLKIVYVGTISEWFDFPLVLEGLKKFRDTKCFLFGPAQVPIPIHERLFHMGPVEHKYVFEIMKRADLLVMPFILSDLILSVNPVKLYEYIFSNTSILTIEYSETLQFRNHVHFYNCKERYLRLMGEFVAGRLIKTSSAEEKIEFLLKNTWNNRIFAISGEILEMFNKGYMMNYSNGNNID